MPPEMVGKMAVAVVYLYAGDAAEGAEHARPYRALQPAVDLLEDIGYADFQCSLDDPPGKYNYWSADYHDELSDDALDVIVDSARNLPGPSSQQLIAHWGGAVGGPAAAATPLQHRNASWVTHPFGLGDTPEGGQEAKAWVKSVPPGHRAVRERRRVAELHRRRGPGPGPRGLRRGELQQAGPR